MIVNKIDHIEYMMIEYTIIRRELIWASAIDILRNLIWHVQCHLCLLVWSWIFSASLTDRNHRRLQRMIMLYNFCITDSVGWKRIYLRYLRPFYSHIHSVLQQELVSLKLIKHYFIACHSSCKKTSNCRHSSNR